MSRLWRAFVSGDHKVVGIQFLVCGLVFLAIGGALAMIMRWQWAYPGEAVPIVGPWLFPSAGGRVTPAAYSGLFTGHGLIMIFFAITPILIGGLGHYLIPLLIGAREMAFPRLSRVALLLLVASQGMALAALAAPSGAPSAGWTNYPPLSTGLGAPGTGQTLMIVAIFVNGISTIVGAINYVTTVAVLRAPGMSFGRLPLSVWGLWLTAILNALFAPVLAVAALLLFSDRVFGSGFLTASGDPVIYQHLFWIFGHPEVYILILPVWGIVGDLTSFFSRKPAFFYRGSVAAMISIASMSGLVYGHHLYQTGIGPGSRRGLRGANARHHGAGGGPFCELALHPLARRDSSHGADGLLSPGRSSCSGRAV